MIYQAPTDLVASMRAKLQREGIPFNAAQSVPAAALRRASESEQAFLSLVERLKHSEVEIADVERRAAEHNRAMGYSRRRKSI